MLNELDRAAATPADTGAARPPISNAPDRPEAHIHILLPTMRSVGSDLASLRSLAISLLRLDGQANIAAANRHHARDPQRTLKLRQTA